MAQQEIESGEISGESHYVPHTPEEMRQLAFDLIAGSALGSWQVREQDQNHLSMIFMPLMFMSPIMIKELQRDGAMHFHGHMRDSFDRSLNGYPMFHRMRLINADDLARLQKMLAALEAINEPD